MNSVTLTLRLVVCHATCFLILRASGNPLVSGKCPAGWTYYKVGNICLKLIHKKVSFINAIKYCREMTGTSNFRQSDIVTIEDNVMLDFVDKVLLDPETDFFWSRSNKNKTCMIIKYKIRHIDCLETGLPMCQMTTSDVGNLCLTKKGGCSHICIPTGYKNRTCSCPAGHMLTANKTACKRALDINVNSCHPNNGGCAQVCKDTNNGVRCSCNSGYAIRNKIHCDDIDECEDGRNGGCQHNCTNTAGGRRCTCRQGFETSNETKCEPRRDGISLNVEAETLYLTLYVMLALLTVAVLGKLGRDLLYHYCIATERKNTAIEEKKADDAAIESKNTWSGEKHPEDAFQF